MNKKYDVAVIGGGPAGSTAARHLAQADFKVLLVDRVNCIGSKVQCAEYVPKLIEQLLPVRRVDIGQEVKGIKTFIAGNLASTLAAPGYVLNRKLWDKNLWGLAKQAGADSLLGTAVTGIKGNRVILQSGQTTDYIDCDVILGCDGPNSLVSKSLGNVQIETSIALQYEMVLATTKDYVEIYFDPIFYGGYAWVFPKGKVANVGLAVHSSCIKKVENLLKSFCKFLMDQRVLKDFSVLGKTAGLIPVGGLADKLGSRNMLLAGDAAGCANPITGAGIMSAVVSGRKAAESIITCFRKPDAEPFADYYRRMLNECFGTALLRASQKRLRRDAAWTSSAEQFKKIIRENWISFPEYYQA